MNRHVIAGVAVLGIILVGMPWAIMAWQSARDRAELKSEIALARAEGLATDWRDFVAPIEPALPAENAAPSYRLLKGLSGRSSKVADRHDEIVFRGSKEDIARMESLILASSKDLATIDQATLLPRCWFDRNWSQGAATLFPEYADMRAAAKLVALRGTLSVRQGSQKSAQDDLNRIFRIANHAREEPTSIARFVSDSIYTIGLNTLAEWAWISSSPVAKSRYAAMLADAVERMPKTDVLLENRGKLFEMLSMVDLCSTQEGRTMLGLRDDDLPTSERFIGFLASPSKARISIVRANRAYWAALKLPPGKRQPEILRANQEIVKAMSAFPTASKIYDALAGGGEDKWVTQREQMWEAKRVQYRMLARIVAQPSVPQSVQVADLLSPFDHLPASFVYDGKRISITVGGYDSVLNFRTSSDLDPKAEDR